MISASPRTWRYLAAAFLLCITAAAIAAFPAEVRGQDCSTCHAALVKGKVTHAAVQMGCQTCHTGIDASEVPHRKTGKVARGLSADQPELCFGCHDKKAFSGKKHVHAAVSMGCTGCHSPHTADVAKLLKAEMPDLCHTCHDKKAFAGKSVHAPVGIGMCVSCHSPHQSENEKLLIAALPDLCYGCHDKKAFQKKVVHAPVAGGMCLGCHRPHAAAEQTLLVKESVQLCLECHPQVRKQPHALAGFAGKGHPIGLPTKGKKQLADPARPGKVFYCGSCHDPHSASAPGLFRFDSSGAALCGNCHKM